MLPNLRTLVLASFAGKVIYALSSLATLPVLTWMLGQESVGLLGFFTSLLMVFMALDGGLTSSVTRELAGLANLRQRAPRRYRLHVFAVANTYLLLFIVLGLLVSLVVALSANFLTTGWLKVEGLELSQVRLSILWMGLFIGLNFPVLMLQAALQGREMQVALNLLYVPYALLRTLGVLAGLYLLGNKASIELYFLLQVVLQLLYLVCLIVLFYFEGGASGWRVRPAWRFVRRGLGFGSGVLMISLTSVVVVQIDKLYLSGMLPLGEYAVYALAGTFAGIPYIFSSSLYAVLFPRFSTSGLSGDTSRLGQVFRAAFCGFAIVLGVTCIAAWFFTVYPLRLIFDTPLALAVAEIMPVLLTGTALQALLIIPFALQLAAGWTALALRLNLASIPLILLSLPPMVSAYGAVGAAWLWLFYNLLTFTLTLYFVVRRFPFLRPTLVSFARVLVFLLMVLTPILYAVQLWLLPGLSDVLVVVILTLLGALLVALAGWCFRKDLAGFA